MKTTEASKALNELRDWTLLEASAAKSEEQREVWRHVFNWAGGYALKNKINLDKCPLTNGERLARQGMIFNHSGRCGKIVTNPKK